MVFDMLLGQYGATGRHLTDHRQTKISLYIGKTYSPAGSRHHLDRAFSGQRPQMFFCGIGRTESKFCGNFRSGRRIPGLVKVATNNIQYLCLPCCQLHLGCPG